MMDSLDFKYKIPCLVHERQSEEDSDKVIFVISNQQYEYVKDTFNEKDDQYKLIASVFPLINPSSTVNYELFANDNDYFRYKGFLYLNANDLYIKTNIDDEGFPLSLLKKIEELQIENQNLINKLDDILYATTPHDGLFIDIFRISPDGKYLEMDITCDNRYKFEHFYVKEYQNDSNIDILSLLGDEFNQEDSRILARISLDKLFGNSMYYANIEIELKEGESAEEVSDSNKQYEVAASDISNVYFYLLPGLVQLGHPCDPCDLEIPIEIQRAFLIMWAHIEAMRLERWKEAEMFYTLIKNNFQNCLSEFEIKQKSCNCHAQKQSNFNFSR